MRRARHLYLAYAKFRGTPLDKVERICRSEPRPQLIAEIYNELVPRQVVQVVVRKDLYRGTSTEAQVGHATFKHALVMGERRTSELEALRTWANGDRGTIVILGARDRVALEEVEERAQRSGFSISKFTENDWPGGPEVTSLVIGPDSAEDLAEITGSLKLL